MEKGNSNPSLSLDTLFPTLNDESFLQFLKDYYKFLQSTKLTLTDISGTFVKGEVITGADSKATGIILSVEINEIIVIMSTQMPFDSREEITGSTSSATATIANVKDNVLRESAKLKESRSQYVSGDEFFQLLKDEVNRGYPSTSATDRRLLYNRIRDLLQSKSTEEAYRFLFKAFFDENIEIRFPGDDLLRVSDGKFEKTSLIRVIPANTNAFPIGTIFDFLNKTIRGQTSGAVGTVVNIQISFLGGIQYAELNLKLVSGEFEAGETIADVLQPRLSTQVFGIIGDVQINDGGSGYSVGDVISITGDGAEATAEVSSISTGPINRILINTPGFGYRLNTRASVNNADTAGDNLEIVVSSIANTYTVTDGTNNFIVGDTNKIQIINRGSGYQRTPIITLVDSTIQSLGLLSERLITIVNSGNNYAIGETLTFTGGSGSNAAGEVASVGNTAPYGEENLLFEDNFVIVQEQEVHGIKSAIKSEDSINLGSILRIELTNLGNGYASNNLPTLTLESANTVSGANASFTVNGIQGVSANVTVDIANNAIGIGSIRQIDIRNPGINFSSANVNATAVGNGNANLEAIISGLNVNRGFFTNDDGKINFKVIQDSFFFQDFSYVIRSGLILDAYKELVKETVHPAGLEFFGEIVITSIIALRAEFRSQIDQSPRPLALSSFLSLFPVGVNFPYSESIREVEITPVVIDQVLIGPRVSKFLKSSGASDDINLSIREIAFERGISVLTDFGREITNRLELFIDASLQIVFNDIQVVETSISDIVLKIESGVTTTLDTGREYQIEIAPIRMEQPLAVRNFNIREIEITPLIDAAINIDDVKTFEFFTDQFGEHTIEFFAQTLISTFAANTFLQSSSQIEQIFRKRIDTQGLEIDIELVSTDLKIQVVDSTSFGTEQEVPLFVSVPLIRSFVDEIVNRLELFIDASLQIVFNDVQVVETSISDIVLRIESGVTTTLDSGREYQIEIALEKIDQPLSVRDFNIREIEIVKEIELDAQTTAEYKIDIFTKADTILYFSDQLLETFSTTQISELSNTTFNNLITVPLAAPGFKPTEYTLRIELPRITVAANLQPFRIFVDRLRLPSLGLGTSIIDASINFDGTSYEIEMRPEFVQFAPTPIPQTTGRLKRLTYIVPPVVATINNIYEVIKIQKEIDVSSIIFTNIFYKIESSLIDALVDVNNLSIREIEITSYFDMRMSFYSEILTMTNRIHTTEIEIQSGPINVSLIPRMKLEIDVPPGFAAPFKEQFKDIQIGTLANQTIGNNDPVEDYSNKTFLDTAYKYQSLSRVDIDYRVEIYPYLDSRMKFYSEILTMTNREMTVELEVFSKITTAVITPQEVIINYVIAPTVIDVANSVRNFNIREIEITPYLDLRMAFYSEILTMTNRIHTTEIEIQSGPINVAASTIRIVTFNIPTYGEASIQLFASNTIADESSNTFATSLNIAETRQVPSSFYKIDILPSKDVTAAFVSIEDRLVGMEKDVILYIDMRMAFYSEILTMTNRVHTTEIEIFSFTDITSVTPQEVVINYVIAPTVIDVSGDVRDFNIREIEITPYLDLRMAFYSEILTMTNRVHTTEIEIQTFTNTASVTPQQIILNYVIAPVAINIEVQSLNREVVTQIALEQQALAIIDSRPINRIIESEFTAEVAGAQQSTLSSLNRVDVRLGNETLGDIELEGFKNTQISLYENQTFNDKVAYAKSDFIEKFFTFNELQIRSLTNDLIEDFENESIEDAFINKNIQKNVFINGTVTFTDPGFSGLKIQKLAGEIINTYSANALTDLSGSKTSIFGTNTEFTADFLVGEALITSTEKFLVTSVSNNTFLEINVNPEENYNDVSVYREFFI